MRRNPLISIIVPCRNEDETIGPCLASIARFRLNGKRAEILIIDGMSEDNTVSVIREWMKKDRRIHLYTNPRKTVAPALNIGIQHARGDYIMRLDAHSEYPPDYLNVCMETARRTGADNVGGIVIARIRGKTFQEKLVRSITTHWFGVGNSEFRTGGKAGSVDTVPFGFFRKDIFDEVGLFDERLIRNQDYEMNRRIRQAGGSVIMNPLIHVYYQNQPNLSGLFRQAWHTGKWNPLTWYTAPYAFSMRHAVPGLFAVYLGLLGLAGFRSFFFIPCMLVFLLYLFLDIYAAVVQSRKYGYAQFFILPLLFFLYHVCYGLGTLAGCILIMTGTSVVQKIPEPWPGAGRYRAWPVKQ